MTERTNIFKKKLQNHSAQNEGKTFFFQPKLSINQPNDVYEQQADAMADKVMRMPETSPVLMNSKPFFSPPTVNINKVSAAKEELLKKDEEEEQTEESLPDIQPELVFDISTPPPDDNNAANNALIQRKCARCEEEEKLQRKKNTSQPTEASNETSSYINSLSSKGSSLPESARSFFEPRFGHDFSDVKIHNDSEAAKSADSINALAYTTGNNIVFNQNQFSPESDGGKYLLAHELTHTIQQGFNYKIQRSCAARVSGEITRSLALPGILPKNVFMPTANSLIIQDFPIGRSTLPPDVTNSPDWQRTMSVITGTPSMHVAMQGYTDCAGSSAENLSLRQQRTAAVLAAMPSTVRSKVVSFLVYTTTQEYLTGNDTPEARAGNRAVQIFFRASSAENDCDTIGSAANLDEYIFMVVCAQNRLHLTGIADTPKLISALRQIYYGNTLWSASQNPVWDNVIPNLPWNSGTNPSVQLGTHLFTALKNSKEVEGIDIGHLLTGIDAMFNPHDVEIPMSRFTYVTNLMNEEWATWAGDVGSAAGEWAIETLYAGRDQDINSYFSRFAGSSDLQGNVEGFAIRLGVNGGTAAGQLGQAFHPGQTFSEILMNTFRITSSAAGGRNHSRVRDFVEAYGGIVNGNRITNQGVLVNRLKPAIAEFAGLYTMDKLLKRGYFRNSPSQPAGPFGPFLDRGIDEMTQQYVNWLEQHL